MITTTEPRVLDSNGFLNNKQHRNKQMVQQQQQKRRFKEIFEIQNFQCICRAQLN